MDSGSESLVEAVLDSSERELLVAGLVERYKEDGRAMYSREGKAVLIALCQQPGVSVAKAAMVNGVNANLLRKWIQRCRREQAAGTGKPKARVLLPVVVKPEAPSPARQESIEVVLARGSFKLAASPANLERLVGLLAR